VPSGQRGVHANLQTDEEEGYLKVLPEGRALTNAEVERIRQDVFIGLYNDRDLDRLFTTIFLQRKILGAMFNLFKREPLRLVSTADPIRNSVLAHYKELVSMEDRMEDF
jgi:hypothetical protein